MTGICSRLNLSPWDDTAYLQCGSSSVNPFLISGDSGIALRNSLKGMPLMFLNPIKVMVQINQNKRSCSPNQCWEKHTQDWKQFLLTSVTLKGPGITQAIHRSLENHCLNAQELVILAMSLNNSLPVTNRAFKSLKLVRLTPGNNFYYCCSRKIFKILLQKYSRIFSIRQD